MCKHILNAQVSVRAPCCRRFFDCPLCHEEAVGDDHRLGRTTEMQFVCKRCRRAFRKDLAQFETEDEYCPHCDNHFVVQAKTALDGQASADHQPGPSDGVAAAEAQEATVGHDVQSLLDERMRYDPRLDWIRKERNAGSAGERIDEGGLVAVLEERQEAERENARTARNLSAMMAAVQGEGGGARIDDDDLDWS